MEQNANQYQEVNELLVKYLTGEASVEERDIVRKWINENSAHQKYFRELLDVYRLTKTFQRPSGFDQQAGWTRIKAGFYRKLYSDRLERKSFKKRIAEIWLPIAASVIIAFLIGFFTDKKLDGLISFKKSTIIYNEVTVPFGARSQVTLSDGTKVWLNAGSKLKYPAYFSGDTRDVYLEGEAFFDVTHIEHKIFIVKTSGLNIKVYGTQFNVKSYPEESVIQTTLIKGSVEVEKAGKSDQKVLLKPNQTATFYKKDIDKVHTLHRQAVKLANKIAEKVPDTYIISKTNDLSIVTWKDPKWVIVGEELGNLSIELERRYNVRIIFEDENLKKYKFSGNLMNETFEQVLKIIQLSAPLNYTIDKDIVVFKEDKLYKLKYDKMIQQ
jgi:transmembrane sensor